MSSSLFIRRIGLAVARSIGAKIIDQRTGNFLGRALIVSWKGKIHVIGLSTDEPLRVIWLPQKRITYWKQEIGFATHPPPDFPNERDKIDNP